MNELISIITPSYNSEKYLKECIESVLNQTYSNWEMLIVDDASIDGSRSIIESYSSKESRIKAILLDENIGAAEARNIAIDRSEGRYIAFLDSDDIWFPEKLDIQLMFMRDNKYSFTFSSYEVITEDGLKVTSRISVPIKISYSQYLKNTIIGCLTVMIDKSKFDNIKMPILRSSHDMALWLDLLREEGYAYGIQQPLAQYRNVKSSNTSNKFKAACDVWKVYRHHENLNFLYSIYNFMFYVFNAFKKRI